MSAEIGESIIRHRTLFGRFVQNAWLRWRLWRLDPVVEISISTDTPSLWHPDFTKKNS